MRCKLKVIVRADQVRPSRPNFRVRGVFNPAAVRLPDGRVMLYARVAETPYHDEKTFLAPRFVGRKSLEWKIERISRKKMEIVPNLWLINREWCRLPTISHFRKIILDKAGLEAEYIGDKPDFYGLRDDGDYGVEDPRITFLKKERLYAMTYVSVSMDSGVSTSLATSANLCEWKRHGIIFRQQNKDVVIFPQKIRGYYVALHRPEGTMIFDRPSIWVSYSRDLVFWGRDKPLIKPRGGAWDDLRIGNGTVPLKTEEGWLEIYHGVHHKKRRDPASRKVYEVGALLLDAENPEKLIRRTPKRSSLFAPTADVERVGFVESVVFPTGIVPDLNGRDVLIYSGAADAAITVRRIKLKAILNSLE